MAERNPNNVQEAETAFIKDYEIVPTELCEQKLSADKVEQPNHQSASTAIVHDVPRPGLISRIVKSAVGGAINLGKTMISGGKRISINY